MTCKRKSADSVDSQKQLWRVIDFKSSVNHSFVLTQFKHTVGKMEKNVRKQVNIHFILIQVQN